MLVSGSTIAPKPVSLIGYVHMYIVSRANTCPLGKDVSNRSATPSNCSINLPGVP